MTQWLKKKKKSPAHAGDARDAGSIRGSGSSPGVGNGNPVFLPGKFHGQRILVVCNSWGHKEPDKTEYAYTHTLCFRSFNHYSQIQKHCMIGIIFNLWKLRSRLNNSSKS